jgi:hypothetical protein
MSMKFSIHIKCLLRGALILALAGVASMPAQTPGDALLTNFRNPPNGAKPRVWWHWMSGNITKDGIRADLEWMKRVGLGGFQNFDAGLNTPQIVDHRLVYMTPEWKDAFRFTATLANQLGLEMAIAGSPGWSESGGPWVTPAQAMKKYVWSETQVEGGRTFTGKLPKPPSTVGTYQNRADRKWPVEFYADSAVVAYRAPEVEHAHATVTSSGGAFNLAALTDGDLSNATLLPAAAVGEKAWIQFEFASPRTIRGATLATTGPGRHYAHDPNPEQSIEASEDGIHFRALASIPAASDRASVFTVAFPAVTARYFRLTVLTTPAPPRDPSPAVRAPIAFPGTLVSELVLHSEPVVNRFQDKAGFSATPGLYDLATPTATGAIRKAGVVDLTSKMRPDGSLDWTPPAGQWVVLRFGYSLTGAHNGPASPEATGLEVDKLSARHVKAYFNNYLDQYKATVGPLMGKRGLQYVITDSWEAGTLNWTDDMLAEFSRRRGYDLRPWMPVLAGRVVESAAASDRVLWDFRQTIGELTSENHYDQLTTLLHARGMGRYSESHEYRRAFVGDGMEPKRKADVPMGAMWTSTPGQSTDRYDGDIRESASVAHIYGQNLVAAESLTAASGAWSYSPETLKPTADRLLAMGLNRFVIHTSVHQPVNDKIPGLGLGPYGQWFTRHETWAEMAKPWTTYLARSSYLLQQGRFVADVLYYYGDDSNIVALFTQQPPRIPAGYNFDYVNSDALKTQFTVVNGRLRAKSGMSYRVLALDANSRHMTLAVLRKLRELAAAGAVVVGPKPIDSPSQADNQAEFRTIADALWGAGKGKVRAGQTLEQALAGVARDFEFSKPQDDTELLFVHRKLADGDIYWVNNRKARVETLDATFRVAGKAAEIWHADTGAIEPASYRTANGGTKVPLRLEANDAVFVVFRKAAARPAREIKPTVETALATVSGPWEVAFQPNRGAPEKITLEALHSWHTDADAGVKYFSGTATYTKTMEAPAGWFKPGAKLWLDLGEVKNLADITVNGKRLGIVWKAPFRMDLTGALKPGANTLVIHVANLWVNRLIGDQQPGATKKYTYTTRQFYTADSPLLASGLLGPVRVLRAE